MDMHAHGDGGGSVFSLPTDHRWGMVALVLSPLVAWLLICGAQALARRGVPWASAVVRRLVELPTPVKAAMFGSYIGCVVHLVLVKPHWEEDRTRAMLFVADAAGFAITFGWALLMRPYWRAANVLMAGVTVGAYAYYVLKGWEDVDLVGLVTTTFELATVLFLLVPDPVAGGERSPRVRERWIAGIAVPLALLSVLGANAIATATEESDEGGAAGHASTTGTHSSHDEGMADMHGMTMGTGLPLRLATAAGPITWPISMGPMDSGMKMVTPHCTARPTPQQQLAAVRLVNQTVAAASRFKSLAVAKAAGYVPITPTGLKVVHYMNYATYLDGPTLDPRDIPVLVYVNTSHGAVLSAAMYLASATAAAQPGGCLTEWHVHTNLCFADAKVVGTTQLGCPQGSSHRVTPPMMHIWLTPVPGGPLSMDPSTSAQVAAANKVPALARPNRTA